MIGVVALVAVGPQRLPGMLKNFGQWMRKLRKMTLDVQKQTGIDEMLKAEGIAGGMNELRSLMRGYQAPPPTPTYRQPDPYTTVEIDLGREYPPEGPDTYGALPDDLLLPPPPKAKPKPEPEPKPASAAEPPAAEPVKSAAPAPATPAEAAPASVPADPAPTSSEPAAQPQVVSQPETKLSS